MKKTALISYTAASMLILTANSLPPADAQTITLSTAVADSAFERELSPMNLVFLAHRGYLREQGIPSYGYLNSAYSAGKVSASNIIQAAVEDGRLSDQYLSDQSYLRATEAQLESLENIH